jgi:hypothetical protein
MSAIAADPPLAYVNLSDDVDDAGNHQVVPPPALDQNVSILVQDDPFWGDDPPMLLKLSRLSEFFPTADQTVPERMNSISRLVLYVCVALSVYQRRTVPLQICVIFLAAILLIWKKQTVFDAAAEASAKAPKAPANRAAKEDFLDFVPFDAPPPTCTEPSYENPCMNFLLGDPPTRGPACVGPQAEGMATNYLNRHLYRDVDDLFGDLNNRFITQPVTTVPNDRDKFADWLFKDASCKDRQCPPYSDPTRNRQLTPNDVKLF